MIICTSIFCPNRDTCRRHSYRGLRCGEPIQLQDLYKSGQDCKEYKYFDGTTKETLLIKGNKFMVSDVYLDEDPEKEGWKVAYQEGQQENAVNSLNSLLSIFGMKARVKE